MFPVLGAYRYQRRYRRAPLSEQGHPPWPLAPPRRLTDAHRGGGVGGGTHFLLSDPFRGFAQLRKLKWNFKD